ncbi:MAG: O-methyltransferase, partial [Candidatus Methanomethylicia archaeon]
RRGKILVDVVREVKPKRVLEIGTLIGYSTILMGKELDGDSHIITIEINPEAAEIAMHNIRRAEILPKVDVLIGDALELIPKLEGEFDLIFIDAEKDEYLDYLKLVEDKLHSGSVVVADNVFHAPSYLDYVRHSGKYKSRFVSAGGRWDGLEVSIKL